MVSEESKLIADFRTFLRYYGHDDHRHGDDLLGRTNMMVIYVERVTARRAYDEFRTDYRYWEKAT